MSHTRSAIALVILSSLAAFLAVPSLVDGHAVSTASQALRTDDAFAVEGLYPRENQIGGGSLRWTKPEAAFTFAGAGPGEIDIDLAVHGHRSDVTILANGAILGVLRVGQQRFGSRVALGSSDLVVRLVTDGFLAPGRTLGAQFDALEIRPAPRVSSSPVRIPMRIWWCLGALIVVSTAVVAWAGLPLALSLLAPALLIAFVLPAGLWRSAWLFTATAGLAASVIVSAAVARRAVGSRASRAALATALLLAFVVHGLLPPSPLVTQADVQMHGNKLGNAAKGDFFPTSRTDHRPPFEIPYGFSFYSALAPVAAGDVENVARVRHGAAFFSALSALGLAVLLGSGSALQGAGALVLWTFAPVNLRTMGFGNLSNEFAQAVFLLFLAGAGVMAPARRRSVVLTLLAAVSATAHLSAFIVLFTLAAAAFVLRGERRSAAFRPLAAGVFLAGVYYSLFLPMIVAQLPRLLGERGGSGGVFDPLRLPTQILLGLGWPFLGLLTLAFLTTALPRVLPLARALFLAAAVLAVAGLVSPVEVRYLLAVVPALAMTAAAVLDLESPGSFPPQSLTSIVDLPGLRTLGRESVRLPLAGVLILAAIVHGVRLLLEFVPLYGA